MRFFSHNSKVGDISALTIFPNCLAYSQTLRISQRALGSQTCKSLFKIQTILVAVSTRMNTHSSYHGGKMWKEFENKNLITVKPLNLIFFALATNTIYKLFIICFQSKDELVIANNEDKLISQVALEYTKIMIQNLTDDVNKFK